MKYYRLFRFDFKYGIVKKFYKYLIYIIFVTLVFFELKGILVSTGYKRETLADYMLFIYGGMADSGTSSMAIYTIPYRWLLIHILILYFSLNYINKDLSQMGFQIIFRCESRRAWWLEKCIWQIVSVIFYYLAAWSVIFILSVVTDAEISLKVSPYMNEIMEFGPYAIKNGWNNLLPEVTLYPLLFTITIALFQMTLCLYVNQICGFIVSIVLCIASAYKLNFFLIGNYSMAIRSCKVVSNGLDGKIGMIVLMAIAVGSVLMGRQKFSNYNILHKE